MRLQTTAIAAAAIVILMLAPNVDIAGAASDRSAPCVGDLDGDLDVDLADLSLLLANYGQTSGATPQDGDLDGDGDVDLADLAALLGVYGAVCPSPPTHVQLAGNSLTEYPFFEYVRAFTEDAGVEVAIDPTRSSELVGATCDLYIVAAKTPDGWDADPTLVDVRAGGAQSVSIIAGGVQDNTFGVASAGELDGDGGLDFGVGYDVVLDRDLNGELSDGDYIDGYSAAAGFYVVKDTTTLGPLAASSMTYSGGSWLGQRTWYPTDIASMGQLPLVVISHGNGHDYTWYDYLQEHLASYGYIVMSHENETGPGIETASTTTLTNTDYILANQATIGGGVLDGHIDASRIVWIGHSRGGEGVARAYDRVYDGSYTPAEFTLEDIVLVSSIAPTDFLGTDSSNPHDVSYHLIYGAADGDVGGYPNNDIADSFNVYERATGFRQSTYVHGADHNDFNCCGFDDFDGPAGTAIGRPEAQRVAKAAFLALVKHYVEGSIPARDFFWRQYENLKPIGVASATTVDREYKEPASAGVFYVDDFQSQISLSVSSSGGAVLYNVTNAWEGLMNDADASFTWSESDPMSGMTRARTSDDTNGLVFDWTALGDRFLDFEVAAGSENFSVYKYLTFRACQGTRHPETIADLGDLTFAVTLEDFDGQTSSINIGAYGGGIEEPYQRTGSGTGAGWQNEFETIRIRLEDFLRNGSLLDLTRVAYVRFEFGTSFGSSQGRVAIDDLGLSFDRGPSGLAVRLLGGPPNYIAAGDPTTLQVRITPGSDTYISGSGTLHYRFDGGAFVTTPLMPVGGDTYEATLPAPSCTDLPEFYVSAEGVESGVVSDPPGAPAVVFAPGVGEFASFYEETLDIDPGWSVEVLWAFGTPTGGGGDHGNPDPTSGYTGSNVYGYNLNGDYEDNMPERHLTTTAIDCSGRDGVVLSFWRYLGVEQPLYDHAYLRVSTNGSTWTTVWQNAAEITDSTWTYQEFDISAIADNQPTVYIRWTIGTTDGSWRYCGWNIDDVRLSAFICEE